MNIKKSSVILMTVFSLSGIIVPTTQSLAATTEQQSSNRSSQNNPVPLALRGLKVRVHVNDNWKKLSEEARKVTAQSVLITPEQEKAKYQELIAKYDGAQIDYNIEDEADHAQARGRSFSEKFVNGGLNDFAYKKSGLADLRSYYGKTALSLKGLGATSGAAAGAAAGFLGSAVGALVGMVGGTVIGGHFDEAQRDMKKWISKGSSKGGCRVTATDEFPIASLGSQKQTNIRKLK
ncbi:hypothetical protein [Levilactobacillus angrenensis]|uniref:Glycine zipper domain-containing protein n=1 Tax=Levilactobacillus angrenensis TaxID=2486020 RepID=A0ABW1U4W3_9LACO|nr:hypothetical protein [Levilactobacillus angrenensis]